MWNSGRTDESWPKDGGTDEATSEILLIRKKASSSDSSSSGSGGMLVPPRGSMGSRGDETDYIMPPLPPRNQGTCFTRIDDLTDDVLGAETTVTAAASSFPVGLINEGCTCYLNSLLQLLFHLRYFRNTVYLTPTEDGSQSCAIPQALQCLFYNMEMRKGATQTKKLTSAFGWTDAELLVQHDIQEMATLLRDNLEERMKGTVTEGFINQLFQGIGEQVVKTLDKTFSSRRRDTFYDIHLPLGPHVTLVESLRSLTTKELLIGDNKYRVEEPGKEPQYKEAEKSYEFCRFPPVIWFHLKRFEMDLTSPSLEMKKINSRLEFPVELSLEEFERGGRLQRQQQEEVEKGGMPGAVDGWANKREEEEEEEEEQKKRDNKRVAEATVSAPPSTSGHPFSTDSPAIYDLQGVIVHRGSVRSGHYYCYIREWDPQQGKFTRWIEFDDDRVTIVPEIVAVNDNFGGPLLRQGKHHYSLATHNAYILSYVRRADCAEVFAPSPTDIIPQWVKEELKRGILEDERREEEENEQRRKLTLFVFTDKIISDYVDKFQRETFPKEMQAYGGIGIRLDMQKTDTVRAVYEAVAAHRKLSTLQLKPNEFRLWLSQPGRYIRPSVPLMKHNGTCDIVMEEYLEFGGGDRNTLMCRCLYLQLPTTIRPFPVTDATSLIKESRYKEELNYVLCFISLQRPVQLDGVTFYLEQYTYRSMHGYIHLILRDVEGRHYEYRKGHTTFDQIVFIRVNMDKRLIVSLEFSIDVPHATLPLKVRDVHLSAPASALPDLQPKFSPAEAALPPVRNDQILLFFNYFNYITCRVVYAGSAMVPLKATVGSCADVLRELLGEDCASAEELQMFEEKQGSVRPLRNDDLLIATQITTTSVLVGQRGDVPQVCHETKLECYLDSVPHMVLVHMHHIVFDGFVTSHTPFIDQGSTGVGSNSKRKRKRRNREDGAVASVSPAVEVVLSTPDVDGNNFSTVFYPPWRFHVVGTYTHFLNIYWTYEAVCETIGVLSGHDPNFIRLYRGSSSSSSSSDNESMELVTLEADPLPTITSLESILKRNQRPQLLFEVLREPRRILEKRPRVVVTVYTEKNESLYMEKVVIRQPTTFKELLQGTLERCRQMLQRASEKNIDEEKHSGSNRKTEMRRYKNKNDDGSVVHPSFTIGSHYLVLVMDASLGVIRKIIEVPMGSDNHGGGCSNSNSNISGNGSNCSTNTINDDNDNDGGDDNDDDRTTTSSSSSSRSRSRSRRSTSRSRSNTGGCHYRGKDKECLQLIETLVEPLRLHVVPAVPLQKRFFRLACCHGELYEMYSARPAVFGQPFVVTVSKSATVSEVRDIVLAHTGVLPSEVDSGYDGIMLYSDIPERFPHWGRPLFPYWKNSRRSSIHIPTLLLNHKRPREKPGSRYVAQNNPTLRISRN